MNKYLLILFFTSHLGLSGFSQTTLTPGDISIISISGDNKSFRFVPLVDLSVGTEIYFTDAGWVGPGFRPNEGAVKYTASALVVAGTNIEYISGASNFTIADDSNVGTNGFLLSTGGDQVLAFQGSTAAPNFIFAAQSNSTQWQASATNSNDSGLPPGLIDGITAVCYGSGPGASSEFDNTWYDCSVTTGTPATVLAAIADQNNWIGNNTTNTPCTDNFFGVPGGGGTPIAVFIHEVQGSGNTVTNSGTLVQIEAVVIGDYQAADEIGGFFVQEETTDEDGDPATSEGIFVYCNTCLIDVMEGDLVQIEGITGEFFDMSQIDVSGADGMVSVMSSSKINLVTPANVSLPALTATNDIATFESIEGMFVNFVNTLTVTEHFQLGRYGQLTLSANGKQRQFTQDNLPSVAGYTAHQIDREKSRIILDDYNDNENIDPVIHPETTNFSVSNTVRGGSTVNNLQGIMHWSWSGNSGTNAWRIRPMKTNPVTFIDSNPRTAAPIGSEDLRIMSFNVLNYFNGNGVGGGFPTSRGANSPAELVRQTDKIVSAMLATDADIIGLVELENDYSDDANSAIANLVDALNLAIGNTAYAYVDPINNVGSDEITNGFIYKIYKVSLLGNYQALTSQAFLDPNNTGQDRNRPAIAQTFEISDPTNDGLGERFTVVINHFKSKGSSCGGTDDDPTTGQGNCNGTRTGASNALISWLDTDPTNSGDPDFVIMGDINAYGMEDPITAFTNNGYTNLVDANVTDASSFVFNGEWGSLDHALSTSSFTSQVSNVSIWNINADESSLLDYNDIIKDPGEQAWQAKPSTNPLFNPDEYRSSDHDPILISLSYGVCPVTLDISSTVSSNIYEAGILITSNGQVPSPNNVDYSAGDCVLMNAGFEVELYANFHAYIDGCN